MRDRNSLQAASGIAANRRNERRRGVFFLFVSISLFGAGATWPNLAGAEPWQPRGVIAKVEFEDNGKPIVIPVEIDGTTHKLLLDTGSTRTMLDPKLVSSLRKLPKATSVSTDGADITPPVYVAPSVKIGGIPFDHLREIRAHDMQPVQELMGFEIGGVIGMDLLYRTPLHIDFDNQIVLFCRPFIDEQPPGTALQMPLDEAGIPQIAAKPAGKLPLRFRVDLGMTGSAGLASDAYRALEDLGAVEPTGMSTAVLVGDNTSKRIDLGRCTHFALADHITKGVVLSPGKDNVLGLSYLRRFRLTLDFPNGTAYFDPGRKFGLRDRGDRDGLLVGETMTVRMVVRGSVGEKAGFQLGDRLRSIANRDLSSMSYHDVNRMFAHSTESDIQVFIQRGFEELTLTIPGG